MPLRRVMRSEDLAAPSAPGARRSDQGPVRIRQQALAATVPQPDVREAMVGRAPILLARLSADRVVAFAPHCPHQGTPLRHASFFEGHLRCPQHNYVYDLETGRNLLPSRDARPEAVWKLKPGYLRVHRVEERDGWIWVEEEPLPPPPGYDPDLEVAPPGKEDHTPAVALPPPRPTTPEAELVDHPVEEVTVSCGSEFELTLPTTPVPGHMWKVEPSTDAVSFLGQAFDFESPEPLCRVRLGAVAEGEATVRCRYGKPWRTEAREVRTFLVRVRPASSD